MVTIDEADFKRVRSALHIRKRPNSRQMEHRKDLQISEKRRAAGKLLESFFSKSGLDLGKLNQLHAQEQAELHSVFEKQKADAAKNASAAKATFRQGIESRLKAFGLLGQLPFARVVLNKPFLIWQLPHYQPERLVDFQINSNDSFMKILVSKPPGSDITQFLFEFLWFNESRSPAVVNVFTPLAVNGFCSVSANAGIFSGDTTTLNLTAELRIIRNSGFGTDDGTEEPDIQQFQFQTITDLNVEGGSIFGHAASQPAVFTFAPFEVSHKMLVVPGRATVIFEVGLYVYYNIDGDPLNISNSVEIDFATNGNLVQCPFVQLDILNATEVNVPSA